MDQSTKSTAFWRGACVAMLVAVGACGGEGVMEPIPEEVADVEAPATWASVSGDSTYWDSNGVLQVTDDDGVLWKLKRYGTPTTPYMVRIWRNNVYEGDVRLTWSGSVATKFRFQSGDWMETDPQGTILNTSEGVPGSGGGSGGSGGGGGVLLAPSGYTVVPDGPAAVQIDWEACSDKASIAGGRAAVAIAGSAMTGALAITQLATRAPITNITRRSVSFTAGAMFLAVKATLNWFDCLI